MPDDRLHDLLHQVDSLPVGIGDPAPVRARGVRLRRRRQAATGTAALALVMGVVLGGSALLGSSTTVLQPAPQASAPSSPSPSPSPDESPSETPTPTPEPEPDGPALPVFDGVDVGVISEVAGEGAGRFLVLNRVELLEGQALLDFYADQGLPPPDDTVTPQVLDARETISYPVAPDAALTSLEDPFTGEPVPSGLVGPVDDLGSLLALPRPDRPGPVFELEVRDGVVVGITQLDVAIG